MSDILTPDPIDEIPRIGAMPSDMARIVAECDASGQWHIMVTTPHAPGRPDGRLHTTTFWQPNSADNLVDVLNDPTPTLTDVLDHMVVLAARKANQ